MTTTVAPAGPNTRLKHHLLKEAEQKEQEEEKEQTHQNFHSDLLCGELSIPRIVKPMVGPALKQFETEVTEDCFQIDPCSSGSDFSLVKRAIGLVSI